MILTRSNLLLILVLSFGLFGYKSLHGIGNKDNLEFFKRIKSCIFSNQKILEKHNILQRYKMSFESIGKGMVICNMALSLGFLGLGLSTYKGNKNGIFLSTALGSFSASIGLLYIANGLYYLNEINNEGYGIKSINTEEK